MMTGLKALDKRAYDIVSSWHTAVNFDPVYKGINYNYLIRYYLWDKVGRALRIQHNIDFNELESYLKYQEVAPFYYKPIHVKGGFKKKWWSPKKIVFIPFQPKKELVGALQKQACKVLSKQRNHFLPLDAIIVSPDAHTDTLWSNTLFEAILNALDKGDVHLIPEDVTLLKEQIAGCTAITAQAEKELIKYKPQAVYLHSDNHPPYINYALAAKKLNIPAFTYQHGLDCEHYYLDDCFADYVAIWSEQRKQRYLRDSQLQPKKYGVVGTAHLPEIKDVQSSSTVKRLLYITRPHRPVKCYSPSRNHIEGFRILEGLLNFLNIENSVHLTIKPHPMDYTEDYKQLINQYDVNDRVTISSIPLHDLLPETSVVVSEDSTAGAEAMRYNLPLIQAHFAQTSPVLPFVSYNAAYPAYDKDQLIKSVSYAFKMSEAEKLKMKIGQAHFIKDFIPKGTMENVAQFIAQNI